MAIAIFWTHDLGFAVAEKPHTERATAQLRHNGLRSKAAERAGTFQTAGGKIPVSRVSRNIATFARDARTLIDGGYKIANVTPVDRFSHTPRRIGRTPKC
jgi:hypothetical protein